jgi:hypothetical protein
MVDDGIEYEDPRTEIEVVGPLKVRIGNTVHELAGEDLSRELAALLVTQDLSLSQDALAALVFDITEESG